MEKRNRANIIGRGPETVLGSNLSSSLGVFSGLVIESPGKLSEAAPPTWHPAQFIRRCSNCLSLPGHFRRKNNLGKNA